MNEQNMNTQNENQQSSCVSSQSGCTDPQDGCVSSQDNLNAGSLQVRTQCKNWKRIVVKVGTTTLVHPSGKLNIRHIEQLVKVLSDIANSGVEVLLVSSGAIAMGVGKLNLPKRPSDIPSKQACAAVGQTELMYIYDSLFSKYNHTVGQVLFVGSDLAHEKRCVNFKNTIFKLLKMGVVPIFNENDTMSTTEIASIGDNDTLAAIVAQYSEADLLILASDVDGLYDENPNRNKQAKLIDYVSNIDDAICALAEDADTEFGTGGMATKVDAAKKCMDKGIDMAIINGAKPNLLYDLLEGKQVGTLFSAS